LNELFKYFSALFLSDGNGGFSIIYTIYNEIIRNNVTNMVTLYMYQYVYYVLNNSSKYTSHFYTSNNRFRYDG
jgi:hypothetical protein